MADSTLWWLLAGGAIVLELLTGTFYLLMMASGFVAAAIAAHLGLGPAAQLVVAAVVGVGAMFAWHRFGPKRTRKPARANRDVNLDIGATIHIEAWLPDGTASVRYRGAQWTAIPAAGSSTLHAGEHRVIEVIGSRLVVEKA